MSWCSWKYRVAALEQNRGSTLRVAEGHHHRRTSLNHVLKGTVLLAKMRVSVTFVASEATCPQLCYKKSFLPKTGMCVKQLTTLCLRQRV